MTILNRDTSKDKAHAILDKTYNSVITDRYIAAGELLSFIDEACNSGEFDVIDYLIDGLDPTKLPPKVLTGVLMVLQPIRSKLKVSYDQLLYNIIYALNKFHGLSKEECDKIFERYSKMPLTSPS